MCEHDWQATGRYQTHAGTERVRYVRCMRCKQIGFRYPDRVNSRTGYPSITVYTWEQDPDHVRPPPDPDKINWLTYRAYSKKTKGRGG